MNIGKNIFNIGKNRINPWKILPMPQNIWPKGPENTYFYPMYMSVALVNKLKKLKC